MTEPAIYRAAAAIEGRVLRAMVAAIPLVGGSISVLIEDHLSRRQANIIQFLFERINTLDQEWQKITGITPYSEALLEHAIIAAI